MKEAYKICTVQAFLPVSSKSSGLRPQGTGRCRFPCKPTQKNKNPKRIVRMLWLLCNFLAISFRGQPGLFLEIRGTDAGISPDKEGCCSASLVRSPQVQGWFSASRTALTTQMDFQIFFYSGLILVKQRHILCFFFF